MVLYLGCCSITYNVQFVPGAGIGGSRETSETTVTAIIFFYSAASEEQDFQYMLLLYCKNHHWDTYLEVCAMKQKECLEPTIFKKKYLNVQNSGTLEGYLNYRF